MKAIKINSTGFDNCKFVRVRDYGWRGNELCEYIIGYIGNTGLYYRLKGFRNLEVFEFIDHLNKYSKQSSAAYFFNLNSEKDAVGYLKEPALVCIPSVDLMCLWSYYKYKNQKTNKYECLISCYSEANKFDR